jgi:hypothetical protein
LLIHESALSIGRLPEFPSQGANQSTSLRLNQGMKAQHLAGQFLMIEQGSVPPIHCPQRRQNPLFPSLETRGSAPKL